MKKVIKSLIFILVLSPLFVITSCSNEKSKNDEQNITNNEGKTKCVVQLSIDNYKKYFDVSFSLRSSVHNVIITFSGCVYEAIYDDCIVTYKYSLNSGDEPTKFESFELNLGGNGSIETKGYEQTISNVTGTLTYWK